ncbi:MAG: hypothetical protein ACF8PN_10380 [Phycisphaerales bacterium]
MTRSSLLYAWVAGLVTGAAYADQINDRQTLESFLGAGGILEEFESFEVDPGVAVALDESIIDHTTMTNGQGPGLVESGVEYDGFGLLTWNGAGFEGIPTKSLQSQDRLSLMWLRFDPPVSAVGFDLHEFSFSANSVTISVIDSHDQLIDFVHLTVRGGQPEFFGYEAPDIASIRIRGSMFWTPAIDDHLYGDPGFALSIDGPCPGRVTLRSANGTHSGPVAFVGAAGEGSVVIPPRRPCAGVVLDLDSTARLLGVVRADETGVASFSVEIPPAACGHARVQAIDLTTCAVSNAGAIR